MRAAWHSRCVIRPAELLTSRGGGVKTSSFRRTWNRTWPHSQILFSGCGISGRLDRDRRAGEPGAASRCAESCVRPNGLAPSFNDPVSPIQARSRTRFQVMETGWILRRIFFPSLKRSRNAMFSKGTMGTWEHTMPTRQKSLFSKLANLFPSHLVILGTWDQKTSIPTPENPRACGIPASPPTPSMVGHHFQ